MVLPKTMRLKGHRCFDYLYKSGRRFNGESILLRVALADQKIYKSHNRLSQEETCKCAVAISSKVSKKAVVRNKLRRQLHQHLKARLSKSQEYSNNWLLFSLRPNCSSEEPSLLIQECDRLLKKAGLLND